jgi:putative sterol carrier protein
MQPLLKKQITSKLNKAAVQKWLGESDGKIIGFKIRTGSAHGVNPNRIENYTEKNFHIVLTKKGASLRDGEYPACDCVIVASEEVLKEIAEGKVTFKEALKTEKITNWGNLHEMLAFSKIMGWK